MNYRIYLASNEVELNEITVGEQESSYPLGLRSMRSTFMVGEIDLRMLNLGVIG